MVREMKCSTIFTTSHNVCTMTSKSIDADIGFNRENVALARSQKLIASWFPSSGGNLLQDKDEDDSEDQYEVELFV